MEGSSPLAKKEEKKEEERTKGNEGSVKHFTMRQDCGCGKGSHICISRPTLPFSHGAPHRLHSGFMGILDGNKGKTKDVNKHPAFDFSNFNP